MITYQKEHGFLGQEFDWLAQDGHGYVAYFSSAGFGFLPTAVVQHGDSFDDLFEDIMKVDETSAVALAKDFEKSVADWIDIARRGLYAFDWNHGLAIYELIARPVTPRTIDTLPDEVSRLADGILLDGEIAHITELRL